MPVPDFQSAMLPILRELSDGKTRTAPDICNSAAAALGLNDDDLTELLPSGKQTTWDNRSRWAVTYLAQAGLLARPKRAHYQITERGREALAKVPDRLTVKYLEQFPEFQDFKNRSRTKDTDVVPVVVTDSTPSELIESGYQILRAELAHAILEQVAACSPTFFEQLVVDMLVAMGYGGSRADAGRAVGQSGDEGIDGIIKEDRLGLDAVYIQAKRWEATVGRPQLQAFAGSLDGQRARKGVFITTSAFSKDARDYAERIEKSIVLIDGERLSELMIDYGVGVAEVASYSIKRLDTDYFESGDL